MSDKDEKAVVLSVEELASLARNGQVDTRAALQALDTNMAARELHFLSENAVGTLVNKLQALNQNVTEENANDLKAANRQFEDKRLTGSAALVEELKQVTALLPENERAAFIGGFLRHNDLLPVEKNGVVSYTADPDEKQPSPGNYLPASLVSKLGGRE